MRCAEWRDDPGQSSAALDAAFALAKRAVELDDGESTCHSLLAQLCLQRRSFELAMEHMRRAVEINPNNQWNAADMGLVLVYIGQAEDALTWLTRARQIDPYFDPPWYWRQAGQACMVLRRFQDALAMFDHVALRTYRIAAFMAGCHARLADMDRARSFPAECLALRPDFSIRTFMSKEPFKNPAESEYLAESLRLAGLPE
jgi:tetratricopeptide (TPR) repeat protein